MAMKTIMPVLVQHRLRTLGERLALARRARELSQIDLAHLADVGVSTVASLEGGHHGVSFGNLLKVLKALDLLEQVDSWLLPHLDPAVVEQGVRAVLPRGRARG